MLPGSRTVAITPGHQTNKPITKLRNFLRCCFPFACCIILAFKTLIYHQILLSIGWSFSYAAIKSFALTYRLRATNFEVLWRLHIFPIFTSLIYDQYSTKIVSTGLIIVWHELYLERNGILQLILSWTITQISYKVASLSVDIKSIFCLYTCVCVF